MSNDMVVMDVAPTLDRKDRDKQTNESVIVEYDELLSSAGECGRYQLILMLSTWPFFMFGVFAYYSQMFITEVSPNHWCWIPELENLTEIGRRNLAIPSDDNSMFGYSQCTAYVANWTDVLAAGIQPDKTWDVAPCQHGWEFNKSEIPYETIASELEWVCDKNSYQATAQSLFFVGSIIGGVFIGWVADKYGRVPAAVTSNLIGCIGGVSSTFTTTFIQFSVCRFVMGMAYDSCMIMAYLLILEYIVPKYKSMFANLTFAVFYSIFVTTLPFLALALGHWKIISLVTSLPLALAIFTPLFIPESPRWLVSKGRIEEAVDKIRVIGRVNKCEVPSKLIEQFKTTLSKEQKEENLGCMEIFRRKNLRYNFLIVCCLFMCCTIVFDGLVRSIGQLDFDFFLSFAAVSFTEFPAILLCAFAMDFFGRRWLTGVLMIVSCIFSLLTAFLGSGLESVIYAVIARFSVNVAYTTAMQWAAELMPTAVRGSAVSIVHICSYVSSFISPYIVYLRTVISWLPLVIIGFIAGIGGILAMILPETVNKDMPNTFEDADGLSKNQKFFEFPCFKKTKNASSEEYVNHSFEI